MPKKHIEIGQLYTYVNGRRVPILKDQKGSYIPGRELRKGQELFTQLTRTNLDKNLQPITTSQPLSTPPEQRS